MPEQEATQDTLLDLFELAGMEARAGLLAVAS